jgi:Tol biopolymer transport system component
MTLGPDQTLLHYRLVEKIGEGGMGVVWKAIDTKLDRAVAIKVLPAEVADDPERLGRFKREAQLLASLSHANIAAIHGLEAAEGIPFLVLELVEGEDLAGRLSRGPLPLDEALEIAGQIADAFEEAHGSGVVHRDLKPANVKVTADGKVKVLDFGLAKAYAGDTAEGSFESSLSQSPTLTNAATRAGVILGTASYMSPEQARGKPVDKRADVWAFGVVLFEMLTGQRPFTGDTVTDVVASLVMREPDWNDLPAGTPPNVRRVLRRCLTKDPRRRLRDIGDARLELLEPAEEVAPPEPTLDATSAAGRKWQVALAVGLVVGALLAAAGLWVTSSGRRETPLTWSALPPPEGAELSYREGLVELSPDGRHVAFVARTPDGTRKIWVRSLDSMEARALPGTEGARLPFWSPDGRWLAFHTSRKLRKIGLDGGAPVNICDSGLAARGGTWSRDGTILFAPDWTGPLYRVSADGGEPEPVTALDASRQELAHRWPHFLPDGRHFLLYVVSTYPGINPVNPAEIDKSGLYIGSLDEPMVRPLSDVRSRAAYVDGHLFFVRDGILTARPFDLQKMELTGSPVSLVEGVTQSVGALWGGSLFSISEQGVLVLVRGASERRALARLTWLDRRGEELAVIGEPSEYESARLSPDESQVVTSIGDPGDLWLFDFAREISTRFTFDPGDDSNPVWTRDGRIIFGSGRPIPGQPFSPGDLYVRVTSGLEGEQFLLGRGAEVIPTDLSPDGSILLFHEWGSGAQAPGAVPGAVGSDIWTYSLEDDEAAPLIQTEHDEYNATFSRDGRWIAYESDESGKAEIYVQAFGEAGGKWQVSSDGGAFPVWRSDDKEIFYLSRAGELMAVPVDTDGGFLPGTPVRLFEAQVPQNTSRPYDVTRDGERFLLLAPVPDPLDSGATVELVQNWPVLLDR